MEVRPAPCSDMSCRVTSRMCSRWLGRTAAVVIGPSVWHRTATGGERRRQVLEGEDERRGASIEGRIGFDADVGQAGEQLLEDELHLHAGQVGAEAEVRPDPEREMGIRV